MNNIQIQKKHQIAGNWDIRQSNLTDIFEELDSVLITVQYAGIKVDSECNFTIYTQTHNIEPEDSIIMVKGQHIRQLITNHFENTHHAMTRKPEW